MGIPVSSLITRFRTVCGTDSNDVNFDDTGCLAYLNSAWWALIDTFQFREKEKTQFITTVAGTPLYEVPFPFEAIKHISIEDLNDQSHTLLHYMDPGVYEETFVNNVDNYAKPTDYVRESNGFTLYPTPDLDYPITVKYWTPLIDLVTGTTPPIPQLWHEIIIYEAAIRAIMDLGDVNKAFALGAFKDTLLGRIAPTESKEIKDTRFAALGVMRNDRQ